MNMISDAMKVWLWMVPVTIIIFVCFLVEREQRIQAEELVDQVVMCMDDRENIYDCIIILLDSE